ncbi:MAG: hypothetical protein VW230_06870 [Candidatus Poseidoniales archaeon]
MKTEKSSTNIRTFTIIGIVGLVALLLGLSAQTALQEFAVPSLAVENVEYAVIDDITADTTSLPYVMDDDHDGVIGDAQAYLESKMTQRYEERQERFETHLEDRIAYLENVSIALAFCIADANCSVDNQTIQDIANLTSERLNLMTEALANGTILKKDDDHQHKHECDDEDDEDDEAHHSCSNYSENETMMEMKMLKLTSQLERLNTTIVALQFCIDNNDSCQANSTLLETLVTKMETQATNINACLTDSLCEELRQKDGRHKRSPMHKARHGGSRHND